MSSDDFLGLVLAQEHGRSKRVSELFAS
jgi:hypothetical protein